MNDWDDTSWAGVAVADQVPSSMATVQKAETGSFVANVSFGTYLLGRDRTPQAKMRRAQAAYHTNPWIGTAESTVTRRVAGLPWHLEDGKDEEYEEPMPGPVQAAFTLLEKPQAALAPEMRDPGLLTRRALVSITSRHIGLCGMSYWYLDSTDGQGIPSAILYVNPARVWPSTTKNGRIVGWVLDAEDEYGHGGLPLGLSELLPFYLDPPDSGPYGTGLYERALLKAQITGLADQHAAYVLGTGGRMAGIVAPKEGTIPEETYNTLVREFRNVNEAPDAAKRTTILRGPVDFLQTGASPNDLNLVELDKLNRDDIFAIWGVPPSQAGIPGGGGLNSGETRKYDEAVLMQGAVHDRVDSIRETIQFGLLDRWPMVIDLEIEEPEYDDKTPQFELASKALNLPLTNAERREIVGFPPFGDARDEEVWLPALLQLAYSGTNGPLLPQTTPPTGTMVFTPELPMIEAKASRRQFLGLRRTVDTRWAPAARKTVAGVLAAQRHDVAAKVRAASAATIARQRKNPQAWLDANTASSQLAKVLSPILASIAETVGDRTQALLKDQRPTKADPFTESIVASLLRKVGERIKGITKTTQDAVAAAIAQGYDQGLSPAQIGDLIEGLPAFDEARAELVARTETMYAYNDAALTSYGEYGVTQVEAIDGDEDEECAARDGQTYDVEEAFQIEDHPNGTLDWVPVFGKAETDGQAMVKAILALSERQPVVNIYPTVEGSTIAPPDVFVTVEPANVVVQPPSVTVNIPEPKANRKRVERDADGRMTGIVEEPDGG